MSKFEQVGCSYQLESENKREAMRSFDYSCKVCCRRGLRIRCDQCAIATYNELVMAAFENAPKAKEKEKRKKGN